MRRDPPRAGPLWIGGPACALLRAGTQDRRRQADVAFGRSAMNRRMIAAVVAVLAGLAAAAQAQNFPARPVTLIVPWPAGGTTDVVMRTLATATEKHLGQ